MSKENIRKWMNLLEEFSADEISMPRKLEILNKQLEFRDAGQLGYFVFFDVNLMGAVKDHWQEYDLNIWEPVNQPPGIGVLEPAFDVDTPKQNRRWRVELKNGVEAEGKTKNQAVLNAFKENPELTNKVFQLLLDKTDIAEEYFI